MTNQGDLVNRIMRAGNYHEKEYQVTVAHEITDEFVRHMQNGVPILGTVTRPCIVRTYAETSADYESYTEWVEMRGIS